MTKSWFNLINRYLFIATLVFCGTLDFIQIMSGFKILEYAKSNRNTPQEEKLQGKPFPKTNNSP